jgi:very-short-patch-repair endonuclease
MQSPSTTRDRARRLRKSTNLPEGVLWRALKCNQLDGLHFRRQHPIGPSVLDFYCHSALLCVEVDGAMHFVGDRPERDSVRDAWLAARGITTVRLPAQFVLKDMDGTLHTILHAVQDRRGRSS